MATSLVALQPPILGRTLVNQNKSGSSKLTVKMELSENVRYMKLLHELKGAFPNMADENIQQCIKQVSDIYVKASSD